ncbi:MAG: TPM domain-containing protein [Pseudomonadota bacterium]|nr:TPM domain-containing protein [Pseudomonadota bacterium]
MRQITLWLCAVLASLSLAMSGTSAMAELPPRPDGPVLDAAGIIPDADEAALDAKLRAYNKDTGRAIIVATVPSLDDQPVDAYAQQLAETWDIGGAESEQGVLFLVAPTERKIRIHTARGVQERLPDVLAGRIIRDTITPRFKARDMAGGITAGVDAIIAQLNRDPAEAKAVAEAAAAAAKQRRSGNEEASVGAVIFWIVLILFLIMLFGRGRRRHGLRRHSDAGIVMWEAGNLAANIAANIAINAALGGRGGDSGGFGGFGGFGGGGGGFDGGGASGDW